LAEQGLVKKALERTQHKTLLLAKKRGNWWVTQSPNFVFLSQAGNALAPIC